MQREARLPALFYEGIKNQGLLIGKAIFCIHIINWKLSFNQSQPWASAVLYTCAMCRICWLPFHKIELSELVNRQSVQSMLLSLKAVTVVRDKKAEQTRLWTGRAEQTRKPNALSRPTKLTLVPLKFRMQNNPAIPHLKIAPTEAVQDKNSTLVRDLITRGSGSPLWEKDSL